MCIVTLKVFPATTIIRSEWTLTPTTWNNYWIFFSLFIMQTVLNTTSLEVIISSLINLLQNKWFHCESNTDMKMGCLSLGKQCGLHLMCQEMKLCLNIDHRFSKSFSQICLEITKLIIYTCIGHDHCVYYHFRFGFLARIQLIDITCANWETHILANKPTSLWP